jgi:hypothetical protein
MRAMCENGGALTESKLVALGIHNATNYNEMMAAPGESPLVPPAIILGDGLLGDSEPSGSWHTTRLMASLEYATEPLKRVL